MFPENYLYHTDNYKPVMNSMHLIGKFKLPLRVRKRNEKGVNVICMEEFLISGESALCTGVERVGKISVPLVLPIFTRLKDSKGFRNFSLKVTRIKILWEEVL